MEKTYALPHSLAQGLVNYLQQRPYVEVAPAIQALLELRELPQEPAPRGDEDDAD